MLTPNRVLRRISDDVLQETDPSRGGKRPFEWRRSFHICNFVLTDPRVVVTYDVNDVNLFAEIGEGPRKVPLVDAGRGKSVSIRGSVALSIFGDQFLQTKRAPGEDPALLEVFPGKGRLQIEIGTCEPLSGDGVFGPGTYPGRLSAWDPEIEKDTLTLDLRAPHSTVSEIAELLSSGKAGALGLQVGLHVFTYEVDDALREPHHSQTFIVADTGSAAAILRLRTLPSPQPVPTDVGPEATPSAEDPPAPASALALQNSNRSSLAAPLWVIAALLALIAATQ